MRIIYCDFDGVLHPVTALHGFEMRLPREEAIRVGRLFRWVHILDELLIGHEDVRIMVHSSWRQLLPDEDLRRYLGPLANRFIGATEYGDRWLSIQRAVTAFQPRAWIVLDDHASEFPVPPPAELLLCEPETGIWEAKIRKEIVEWLRFTALH